jgi:cytochrome c-type biogenesis protein
MATVFETMGGWLAGSPLLALTAALLWGVLSILLSPCHLASIPLVVGYIARGPETSRRSTTAVALVFALGVVGATGVIAAATALAGGLIGDLGPAASYVAAAVLIVVGLNLLGAIELPLPEVATRPARRGMLGALALGAGFGLALGPCTFAFMAPVLVTSLAIAGSSPIHAAGLLMAFGVGHCIPIVGAGASTRHVERWLQWGSRTSGIARLRAVSGTLVIVAGLYLLLTA